MRGKNDLVSRSWPNNFLTTRLFEKSFRQLLDKAFAHNLVARSGSSIKPMVLNLTRKNSTLKASASVATLWILLRQHYEYYCFCTVNIGVVRGPCSSCLHVLTMIEFHGATKWISLFASSVHRSTVSRKLKGRLLATCHSLGNYQATAIWSFISSWKNFVYHVILCNDKMCDDKMWQVQQIVSSVLNPQCEMVGYFQQDCRFLSSVCSLLTTVQLSLLGHYFTIYERYSMCLKKSPPRSMCAMGCPFNENGMWTAIEWTLNQPAVSFRSIMFLPPFHSVPLCFFSCYVPLCFFSCSVP